MDRSYFCPLVNKPIVITGPGTYRTRAGETVEVHISSIRRKLAPHALLHTERGIGFRLAAD